MRRTLIIAKDTLKKQVKSGSYWFMVIFPVVIGIIFSVAVPFFTAKFDEKANEKLVIDYEDPNNFFVKRQTKYMTAEDAKKALKDEEIKTYAHIEQKDGIIEATVYGDIDGEYKSIIENAQKNLNYHNAKLDQNQKSIINNKPNIKLKETKSGYNMLSYIIVIFLFLILNTYLQLTLVDISQDKGSKRLEFLFSSVKPEEHFVGKILGVLMAIVINVLAYLIFIVLGYLFIPKKFDLSGLKQAINLDMRYVIITLILVVLAVVFYTILGAILGSYTKKIEDAQKYAMPAVLLLMVGYFTSLFPMFSETLASKIMSYIPLWSAFKMPNRLIQADAGMTEGLIAIAILVISVISMFVIGGKIYKKKILYY